MEPCELQRIENQILETIDFYRGIILDGVQIEISDPARWERIRSRLLKALGERGLEGRTKAILSSAYKPQESGAAHG